MTEREYELLRSTIKQSGGLLNPIDLLDAKIIDGRNRQRVCDELGIRPHYREIVLPDGMTRLDYVRSVNEARWHLTASEISYHLVKEISAKLQKSESDNRRNQQLTDAGSAACMNLPGVKNGSWSVVDAEIAAQPGVSQRTVLDGMRPQKNS